MDTQAELARFKAGQITEDSSPGQVHAHPQWKKLEQLEQDMEVQRAKKREEKLHKMRQQVDQGKDALGRIIATDHIRSVLGKRAKHEREPDTTCYKCDKVFELPWMLRRHLPKCHRKGRTRTVVAKNGIHECKMCGKEYPNLPSYKKHVFQRHSDLEVFSMHDETFEEHIGDYELERNRGPLMTNISKGWLEEIAKALL